MNEKKNIDRLFQEKFKNFEDSPGANVWEKVNVSLHGQEEKVAPISLWWKVAGIAAIVLILLTAGNFILKDSGPDSEIPMVENQDPKIDTDKNENSGTEINSSDELVTNDVLEDNLQNDNTSTSDDNTTRENNLNKIKSEKSTKTEGAIANTEKSEPLESNDKEEKDKSYLLSPNKEQSAVAQTENDNEQTTLDINSEDVNKGIAENTDPSTENENLNSNPVIKDSKKNDKDVKVAENDSNKKNIENQELDTNKELIKDISESERVAGQSKILKEERTNDPTINKDKTNTDLPTNVTAVADNKSDEETDSALTDAIANADEINEEEEDEEEKINRWNISPNVSPVYFNSLSGGSTIDSQFNNNSKTGEINFSYGINGSYAINNRLKVRAGVNRLDLGYRTNDVIVYRGLNSTTTLATASNNRRLSNIKLKEPEENTSFLSATNINFAVIPDVVANNIKGSLDQEIGFIEIPLEVEYSLINKRVGLNLIGGFSTFLLNKNEVYSTLQGDRRLIGEATNLNNTSYSANLGLGLNFYFTRNIDLSLEPTFKYQLNTFTNTSGDFQPYVIGVYSGLRFKF